MSDAVAAAPSVAPIPADFLPPNLRKHVDPAAPVPLRMMAAKGLVPLSPSDQIGALFLLTFDPDGNVRDAAKKTAQTLPERILSVALRDEGVKPPVLGFFLQTLAGSDAYEEMLILNPTTPDLDVAEVAKGCSARICEIISQNQLRILRHEDIIRQLCQNPAASGALVDGVCDFAVRSGVHLADVPQMKAARVRLFGPEAADAPPPDLGPTAEEVLGEFKELADDSAGPIEEGARLSLTQRVMKMSIAQKIKLATLGNKEARNILARDTNKLVAVAVIRSPRITDGEVLSIANNRAANDEVLRVVYSSRDWTRAYPIKLALVKNPKIPLSIAMKFLGTLREPELKDISRNKNVPSGVQQLAKKMIEKKAPRGGGGGH
jgi:hypothetical protein